MKYLEENHHKYIENGESKVRVELITLKPSPLCPGRTLKVFEVVEVVKTHPENPIGIGYHLCLSFPNMALNAKFHDWKVEANQNEGWVETQVPLQISDAKAVAIAHRKGMIQN